MSIKNSQENIDQCREISNSLTERILEMLPEEPPQQYGVNLVHVLLIKAAELGHVAGIDEMTVETEDATVTLKSK